MESSRRVLEQAVGRSPPVLEAIADLGREVLDTDGGRLKMEWGCLRGFLGLYGFGDAAFLLVFRLPMHARGERTH